MKTPPKTPSLLELLEKIPESVKKAISKYNFMTMNITECHNALIEIRDKFELPPWHPLTLYIKKVSCGAIHGYALSGENCWAVKHRALSDYFIAIDEIGKKHKARWIRLAVKAKRGDYYTEEVRVDVCPQKKLVWSYRTETTLGDGLQLSGPPGGSHICVSTNRLLRVSSKLIKEGATCKNVTPVCLDIHILNKGKTDNTAPEPIEPVQPDTKTETDYKPPMFPFDYDINKTDMSNHEDTSENTQGFVPTEEHVVLLKLMGEISSAQLEKLGAQETAFKIKLLVKQLTGATNE